MKDRIKLIRKELELTQEEFSSKIGLSRNFIAQIESGAKVPSARTIKDICEKYSINEEWLCNGIGEKNKKLSRNEEIQTFINSILKDADDSIKKRILLTLVSLDERDWETIAKLADNLAEK